MKIETILLENFGLYGGKRFQFDGQPLILIYGANESGKTTTLNGLRQALFGFPHNSAYITGKPMSAEGTLRLGDGRTVRFTRQKKRADSFTATVEGKFPLSEAQWFELAGGLDLKTYQSLFGFSLEELRSGEKALVHAPLSQALSGSGFGGLARLQQVQGRIDGFLSSSLKRNGIGGTINAKLAEIEAAEKQLESVLTLPSDVSDLRQQLTTAGETVEQLSARVNELRVEFERCQRHQAAMPREREYRQVAESLKAHEIPAAIDEEFRLQWTVNQNRLAGARSEIVVEQRKLVELQQAASGLPAVANSGPNQESVCQLGIESQQITQLRRQIADESREADELDLELKESLRRLGLTNQDDQWRSIELDLAQRAELDGARQLFEQITAKLSACRTRMQVAVEQLQKQSALQPRGAVPANLDHLETLARDAQPIVQSCEQLEIRLTELHQERSASSLVDQLHRATRALAGDASATDVVLEVGWDVPSSADVAAHQQQLAQATAHGDCVASELEQCLNEMKLLQQEQAEAQAAHGLVTLAQLHSIWSERDSVIAQWREELRTPLLASSALPVEHEQRLGQIAELNLRSDNSVRSMLAAADRLALFISKQQRLSALASKRLSLVEQSERSTASLDALRCSWRKLWSGCPITPETPAKLGSWLESYRSWCESELTAQRLREELTRLTLLRDAALEKLFAQWPQFDSPCVTVGEAQGRIQQWRSQAAAAVVEGRLIDELKSGHSAADAERAELERQIVECQANYRQTVRGLQLPESWPIEETTTRLDALARCQKLAGRADKIRQRVKAAQKRVEDFALAVAEHARGLGSATEAVLPEQQAKMWVENLERHNKIEQQRRELTSAIATQNQTIAKRQAQLEEFEEALLRLASAAGASTLDEVQEWIVLANSVFQLRARKAQLGAALEANSSGASLQDFLNELGTLSPRSVTAAAASMSAQLSSAEAARQAAIQQLGALTRELEYKEQGSAALDCEQRLKRLRSELVELSEQWVVHRLAGDLLERTIDRFTRDHEPQLLKHTRRFFRELTDERYCVVEHDSGKHGGFGVRDQHGHAWQPDKLSTGTREQLYLAIRLAFITHFNDHHEPLPVIMDDCFVNFDDTRARIALRTLIHWQESVQTILLSCHWRSIEAMAELAPETPVITLVNGEMTTARQLADRAEDYGAGRSVSRLPI